MDAVIVLSLKVYLLVAVISMVVAVMIRGIVLALSRAGPATEPAPQSKPAQLQHPGEPDIAAIAAAVYAIMGDHHIVSIRDRSRSWAAGGRAAHHSSHNLSHRPNQR